uniref:Zgc:175088 n=1 Tax=Cyprinus carpio TaxID=7962 RepID=A0A8C1WZK4_CYPCA
MDILKGVNARDLLQDPGKGIDIRRMNVKKDSWFKVMAMNSLLSYSLKGSLLTLFYLYFSQEKQTSLRFNKMPGNLLKNPNGYEDLEHWELTENGGDQWRTEDMPEDCGHTFNDESITKYFCTSFELCMKRQVIDLLAEGYDPENLDIAQPAVNVEDWFCSRADCGCIYMLTVTLLDENLEVIEEFKPDEVTLDPDSDDCSWKQV